MCSLNTLQLIGRRGSPPSQSWLAGGAGSMTARPMQAFPMENPGSKAGIR